MLGSVRSEERFLADGKRRLRRLADTCVQRYKKDYDIPQNKRENMYILFEIHLGMAI